MPKNNQIKRFILQIRLLRWAGISLKENETIWYNLYSYVLLAAILSATIFGLQGIQTNRDRLDALIENLIFGVASLTTLIKILSIYFIRKKLGRAMVLLDNDIFAPNLARGGEEEEKLLNECMVYANAQGLLLVLLSFLYSLSPNIQTGKLRITHSDNSSYWILPFGSVSIMTTPYSPAYEMVWAYQWTTYFMACIGYSSTNVFTAAVMAFLSAQCRILQNCIKTSVRRSYSGIMQQNYEETKMYLKATEAEWGSLQKSLKEIVEYHLLITDTAYKFEKLFYIPTLLDFFGLSILICIALFYGTLVPGLNYRCLQMVALAVGSTALQFMTSYWGSEVTVQYSAIGKACSEVDYIGTDIRFQKGLCLIMQRTQKPIEFTVGKFAPLTLGTFITVLKAAYSYCMLLHNLGI